MMKYCVTIQRYQRIFMIQKVLSIPMNPSGAVDEAMFKSRLHTNKPVLVQVHRRDLYKRKRPKMPVPVQCRDLYEHWDRGLREGLTEIPDFKHFTK